MGWLAGHVGTVPEWITMTINTRELDYAPVDGPSYEPPKIENRNRLLAAFDKGSAEARAALAGVSDDEIMKGWKLLAGGQEIFTLPRVACIRSMCMNHLDSSPRAADHLFPAGRSSRAGTLRSERR